MPWDPDRYNQFYDERAAPFEDLFSMVKIRSGLNVVDLGCGSGELTSRLAERLPGSDLLGIDSSLEMLSRASLYERPGLRFKLIPIQDISGQWDLVFSNSALQWVADHSMLVPRLFGLVRPAGQLAVQLPANHEQPAHLLLRETAAEAPFEQALNGWQRISPVLPLETYAELLFQVGGRDLIAFEKAYPVVLEDAQALLGWAAGTALVPYLERLPASLHQPFKDRYRQRLLEHWPSGPIFYAFKRILFSARRPER